MAFVYLSIVAAVAASQPRAMTIGEVLQRARAHAPALVDARAAAGEARARLRGASPFLAENPQVAAAAGRRSGADERDLELGVSQAIEIAGQRGLRVAAGRAGVDRADASLDFATRQTLAEAAGAFYRLLHAQERLGLARHSEDIALRVMDAAQKRYDAGDIAALDLNLAKIALGRAKAEAAAADAERLGRDADLRTLLGMRFDEALSLAGDLRDRPAVDERGVRAASGERPEILAAAAELREAEAELMLGRRAVWPALSVTARYTREEGTPIAWGGVSVSLPIFKRGQEEIAGATARVERARVAGEAARRRVETQTESALAARRVRAGALRTLEDLVLPGVEDNDALARRSFEVGELGLAELLLVRREGLEARQAHLDALLAAALTDVELLARAGGLQ
jgi:outer membrane protein, heavy metal efflux system